MYEAGASCCLFPRPGHKWAAGKLAHVFALTNQNINAQIHVVDGKLKCVYRSDPNIHKPYRVSKQFIPLDPLLALH